MKPSTRICALLLLAALLLGGCGKAKEPAKPQGKSYFSYFDTVSYVYSYAGDDAETFDANCAQVSALLEHYHKLFDIYHEYAGMNNLCTLNRQAGGEALPVEPELIAFLRRCEELYRLTGGEMNVMMGAVLHIWHEHREAAAADPAGASVPEEEALRAAAEHIDFSLLEIDEAAGTVRIADPEASIDVGAIGKGYAVEAAARDLEAQGVSGYVLNVGGNIRILGTRPDGTGWLTGIRDPRHPDDGDFALKLRLQDTACVTSGVYERYFTVGGARYHHIIDKDTLFPSAYFSSLTVVCKDSGLADALSTALFCMPYEDGRKLAEAMDGVEVLWIFPDGETRCTDGIAAILED